MSAPLLRPLLGAAALLLAGAAAAVPAPVALHGSVRELGEGAAEVRISATCLATGEVTRTRSGAGGGYAFDALAPCAYW
ncbi:MAG TPA: carboxypeptidase-like regulatory domain-containing protein, partial [Burkholderiaceae bacterium]